MKQKILAGLSAKGVVLKTWLVLCLLLVGVGTSWATDYELVTSASQLVSGANYIIADGTSGSVNVISTESNTNNRRTTTATVSNNKISGADAIMVFTLGGSSNAWTFTTTNYAGTDGFLYNDDTNNNRLKVGNNTTTNAFTISFSSNVISSITCNGNTSKGVMCFNGTLVACYGAKASGYKVPQLYKEISGTNYTVTIANDITGGSVTASTTSATAGTIVNLTAIPSTGYEFCSWNVTGATVANNTSATTRFTMPAANVNVSATFNEIQGGGEEPGGEGTTGTINFGNNDVKINTSPVQGDDDLGNSWTITTVGTTSFTTTNNDYQQIGSSKSPATSITFTTTLPENVSITKMSAKFGGFSDTAGDVTLKVGETTIGTGSLNATNDVTVNSTSSASGNVLTVTVTGIAKGVKVYDISYTYTTDGDDTPQKTTPTLSFSPTNYNATIDGENSFPTLTTDPEDLQGITYSSSNTGVATVNASTGEITLVAAGTTTITASFAGNETYNAASASYDLVVSPAPFASLEDLVAANLASGTNVTVSFENVPIKAFQTVSSARKGVYFDIQKGGNDIEIYFNSEVPAEWVEGGKLSGTLTNCPWKLYNSTWELAPASGWSWSTLNYTAPVLTAAPTITTQPVSATYELNASATNLTVAASGNPAPTYQWYSNTTNSNENGTELTGETNASYKPNTATAGTFYYYCVATNSEGTATSSVATITVKEPVTADLPFSFDGGKNDIASKDGMSQTGLGSDYNSSPKLKFDDANDNVIINFNEAAKKVTYTIKGNSTSGTYAFDVMESVNGVDYTTVHSHTAIPSTATVYNDNLVSTSRFVKFVYTTKSSGNVALGNINIIAASYREEPNLAFDKATYKFIAGKDMQVTASSKAGSTGAITYALTEGDEDAFMIDEETGEIACYTAGTYTVTATIAETADYYSRSTTCTVNVVEPIVGNSIIVAEASGNYYAMTTTCEGSYFGYKSIKKVDDKYVVSGLDDILFYTNTADGQTTIQSTSNNEYVQATAAKAISYTEDEYKWKNDGETLTAAEASNGTLQYNTSNPRFTTYATKIGQYATIVDLANVVTVYYDLTVTNAGYATLCLPFDATIPSTATVYTGKYNSNGTVTLNEVEDGKIKAGEGYIVANEGPQTFCITSDEVATPENNDLKGVTERTQLTGDGTIYIFANQNQGVGFYKLGQTAYLGANKAYLQVPAGGSAREFVGFGDETAISTIDAMPMTDGKYLKDGKIIIVKNGMKYNVNGQRMR